MISIMLNVVIPVIILTCLSKEKYLGPVRGLIVALILPIGYGIHTLIKEKRADFVSIIGIISVLLTGVFGILGLVVLGGLVYLIGWPKLEQVTGNLLVWGPVIGLAALFGFMAFAFAPAALASLGDVAKKRSHGVTMSVYSMVISAGMMIGTPLSGAVLNAAELPGVLAFFGVCVGLMLFFVILRNFDLRKEASNAAAGQATPAAPPGDEEE